MPFGYCRFQPKKLHWRAMFSADKLRDFDPTKFYSNIDFGRTLSAVGSKATSVCRDLPWFCNVSTFIQQFMLVTPKCIEISRICVKTQSARCLHGGRFPNKIRRALSFSWKWRKLWISKVRPHQWSRSDFLPRPTHFTQARICVIPWRSAVS